MNTINTLTVNGQSYALPDPRSVLDDSAEYIAEGERRSRMKHEITKEGQRP